jgi:hypothetical protein
VNLRQARSRPIGLALTALFHVSLGDLRLAPQSRTPVPVPVSIEVERSV